MAVVTAPALRRNMVPTARARIEAAASRAAVPSSTRSRAADVTGNRYTPLARESRSPSGTATAAPAPPPAQPRDEVYDAQDDRLGRQPPAPPRAGGQRNVDQVLPVFRGDEQRP